ncbi:MAG: hypothetical protein HYS80_02355 [Candidatus Aenigmarchaeota archaeon]|nr:hypothetical protein [Candidatus Aenigmarchaeota archaeon]
MKVYITVPFMEHVNKEGMAEESFVKFIDEIDFLVKKFNFSTSLIADVILAVDPNEGASCNLVLGIAAMLKKDLIILLNEDTEHIVDVMYRGLKNMTNSTILIYKDREDLRKKLAKTLRKFKNNK